MAWFGPLSDPGYSSNDPATRACSDEVLFSGVALLWIPWGVLVGLTFWALVVWARRASGDARALLLVAAGWVAVVVTCPIHIVILGGMNCGM